MSVKFFGVKGAGGVISIILPIAMWLIERLWQKNTATVGYEDSVTPTGETTK